METVLDACLMWIQTLSAAWAALTHHEWVAAYVRSSSVMGMVNHNPWFMIMVATLLVAMVVLLSKGIKVAVDRKRKRLVYLAKGSFQKQHFEELVKHLKSDSIDINAIETSTGLSVFQAACLSGNEDLISFLCDSGADIMSPCPSGDSPVYLAVFACIYYNMKKTAAIKVLLASGCSVNVQNNNGFTPLHLAAMYGSFNFTQFLLNEGADPCITNMDGLEPADLALHAGHLKIQKILQETKCMKAHIIK